MMRQDAVGPIPAGADEVEANDVGTVGDGNAHHVGHLGIQDNVLENDRLYADQLVPTVVDGGCGGHSLGKEEGWKPKRRGDSSADPLLEEGVGGGEVAEESHERLLARQRVLHPLVGHPAVEDILGHLVGGDVEPLLALHARHEAFQAVLDSTREDVVQLQLLQEDAVPVLRPHQRVRLLDLVDVEEARHHLQEGCGLLGHDDGVLPRHALFARHVEALHVVQEAHGLVDLLLRTCVVRRRRQPEERRRGTGGEVVHVGDVLFDFGPLRGVIDAVFGVRVALVEELVAEVAA
mmetsp:Transcript_942/g.2272  ORF Transcript_942/g.2272 Transcript_942/m.2272 type:complete len:292 (-) Transcript_942:4963-5838(-)